MQLVGEIFHPRRPHNRHTRGGGGGHFYIYFFIVQLAAAQHLAEFLAGAAFRCGFGGLFGKTCLARRRQEGIENAVFGGILGAVAVFADGLLADVFECHFHQIAHNAVDIAADIAHFGEFSGFDFDKRRIGQPCQAAGNFGFAHAGGADHKDVFGHDFALQRLGHLASAVAVAQCHGHGAFGFVLADNVLIQLVNDFLRGHYGGAHGGVSLLFQAAFMQAA